MTIKYKLAPFLLVLLFSGCTEPEENPYIGSYDGKFEYLSLKVGESNLTDFEKLAIKDPQIIDDDIYINKATYFGFPASITLSFEGGQLVSVNIYSNYDFTEKAADSLMDKYGSCTRSLTGKSWTFYNQDGDYLRINTIGEGSEVHIYTKKIHRAVFKISEKTS